MRSIAIRGDRAGATLGAAQQVRNGYPRYGQRKKTPYGGRRSKAKGGLVACKRTRTKRRSVRPDAAAVLKRADEVGEATNATSIA